MRELRANKPRYILILRNDVFEWVTGTTQDSFEVYQEFEQLRSFVESEYVFRTQIEDFSIFEMKQRDNDSLSLLG